MKNPEAILFLNQFSFSSECLTDSKSDILDRDKELEEGDNLADEGWNHLIHTYLGAIANIQNSP